MLNPPSPTESNGRSAGGRFGPGNRCARGNPHAGRVARLRAELLRAVTPQDLRDVVAALLAKAKAGEVAAIKELLQRLLSPPVELDLLQRIGDVAEVAAGERRQKRQRGGWRGWRGKCGAGAAATVRPPMQLLRHQLSHRRSRTRSWRG